MATIDPFTKGGGTTSGGSGALPSNAPPPYIGPYRVNGDSVPAKGPIGGRTNPQWTNLPGARSGGSPDYGRPGGNISDEGAE